MWFQLGFQNFIGKKNVSNESCDIFISDFQHIWHKSLSNEELLMISKKLNPLLEATVHKLKDITMNLVEDVRVHKEIREDDNNNIRLKLQSSIMGVKFQFEVSLKQGEGAMFFKELTTPLLLLIMKIQNRENKLKKIIQDKDAEIRDYKQEYGVRSNYLTTSPFNEKEFDCHESEPSISWDPSSFLECISAKVSSIGGMATVLKEEEPFQEDSKKNNSVNKCDVNKFNCRNKSFNSNSGFKPFIFTDDQTIKRRKANNEEFKIKF